MLHDKGKEREELSVSQDVMIYYSSRTHSQLTQFADEVRRVKISVHGEREAPNGKDDLFPLTESIKYLTLGSRKNLCINPKVSRLGSNTAINEKCLDLQSANTPVEHKCSFLPNKENEAQVDLFRDHAMAVVRDIEDLGNLGKKIEICPYYASRSIIKASEVIISRARYSVHVFKATNKRGGGQSPISSAAAEVFT